MFRQFQGLTTYCRIEADNLIHIKSLLLWIQVSKSVSMLKMQTVDIWKTSSLSSSQVCPSAMIFFLN